MHGDGSAPPPAPRRRRRRAALAGALLVAVAAAASVAWVARGDEAPAPQAVAAPTTTTTTVAPTTAPTPTVAPRTGPLPVPEYLPADEHAPTPQVVVGTIEIPALGVAEEIQRGITLTAINRGPGWWPGTAMPGEWGNVVVAGHRTTYSKPFADLDELVPGDQVVFTTDAGRFTYEVRGVITVPGDWIDIAAQSEAHTATLFACHPPGSAAERVVAKLRLLHPDGTPVDPEAALPALDAEAQRTDHTLVMRPPSDPDAARSGSGALTAED